MPVTDYPLSENNVDPGRLHLEIDADPAIIVAVSHVSTEAGIVHIFMADVLPAAEETALNVRIELHTTAIIQEALPAKIATGTYTGDGTTSQLINTGKKFQIIYARSWQRKVPSGTLTPIETMDEMIDDDVGGGAYDVRFSRFEAERFIALGVGTFTVGDEGGDAHPNASGQIYNYLVLGR